MQESPRDRLREWAQEQLANPQVVILDTETTGLGFTDEICQIAVIAASTGEVLLDTLIRPSKPPEAGAVAIHGLTMERLADAPRLYEVAAQLRDVLHGKRVLIYNADFDLRLIHQSMLQSGMDGQLAWFRATSYADVMHSYSEWVGDWSDYHGNYRWQKLPGGDHTALGDCRATRDVLRLMAGIRDVPITALITPEQARWFAWTQFDRDLQGLFADFLDDYIAVYMQGLTTDRQRLISDWMQLWLLDVQPGVYTDGDLRRQRIADRASGVPTKRLEQIAALLGDVRPEHWSKSQLLELLGRVLQLAQPGGL